MKKSIRNITERTLKSGKFWFAMGVVFLIFIWAVAALIIDSPFVLPAPWETIAAIPTVLKTRFFLNKVGATVWRTLKGFTYSFLAGAACSVLSLNSRVENMFKPVITFLRSVPTLVLTVLFLLWFSKDDGPMVIGMMMVFPVIYTGLLTALKNIDKNLLEMAKLYGVSKNKIRRIIYVRSVLPYMLSTAESSLGMNFKVVVSAEVLIFPVLAVGREIFYLQQQFLYNAEVFAWIIVVLVVIILLEGLIGLLKRILIRW